MLKARQVAGCNASDHKSGHTPIWNRPGLGEWERLLQDSPFQFKLTAQITGGLFAEPARSSQNASAENQTIEWRKPCPP